jgi:hypothetical protein
MTLVAPKTEEERKRFLARLRSDPRNKIKWRKPPQTAMEHVLVNEHEVRLLGVGTYGDGSWECLDCDAKVTM